MVGSPKAPSPPVSPPPPVPPVPPVPSVPPVPPLPSPGPPVSPPGSGAGVSALAVTGTLATRGSALLGRSQARLRDRVIPSIAITALKATLADAHVALFAACPFRGRDTTTALLALDRKGVVEGQDVAVPEGAGCGGLVRNKNR